MILKNKANLARPKMNVRPCEEKDYENEPHLCRSEKQTQTKPISDVGSLPFGTLRAGSERPVVSEPARLRRASVDLIADKG